MGIYRFKGKWRAEAWIHRKRVGVKAGFATKNEARDWLNQTINDFRTAKTSLPPQKLSFDDLLDRFQRTHLPTVSIETRRRYLLDIEKRIRSFFEYRELSSIDTGLIETFRSNIMKDLSAKSVNNCMAVLRVIFRKAEQWGIVTHNPMRLTALKIPQMKYQWWDQKQHLQAFLKAARESRYYTAYRLGLECGMRLGEIVGLSKQDVNFDLCQIHIHRQWNDKERCYGPTKGRKERFVGFNPESELRAALRNAIQDSPHPEAIFVTQTGKIVTARRLAANYFQSIIKRSGVPKIRFHDLRHTFASWYMIEVDDVWSLKGLLGHADIQTTQRYAHLSRKHQKVPKLSWSVY